MLKFQEIIACLLLFGSGCAASSMMWCHHYDIKNAVALGVLAFVAFICGIGILADNNR